VFRKIKFDSNISNTKWQAYRNDDMLHPIFEQKIYGAYGFGRVTAMNLLSTRLRCKGCGKMSIKHFDKEHSSTMKLKVGQVLTETWNQAQLAWTIKKQIIITRCQKKNLRKNNTDKYKNLKGLNKN